MLLDEGRGQTDQHDHDAESPFPADPQFAFFQGHREDAHRVGHVQRGEHARGGVKGVDKGHQTAQEIVAHEDLGPQILPRRVEDIDRHRDDLRDEDELGQPREAFDIVQQAVDQRAEDEQVPEDVEDGEILAEGDHVVQRAMDRMADLRRDQVFGEKVEAEVEDPAEDRQLHVRKLRRVEPGKAKLAVINDRFLHAYIPRRECFSDTDASGCSDRGRRCAPAAKRPSR